MPGLGSPIARSTTASRLLVVLAVRLDLQVQARPVEAADDLRPASRRCSRSTISSRTGGEAVAVSASTVGWPSRSTTSPSRR